MIVLLYKVNNYMPTIHMSFCHSSKLCDNFLNLMLEALKVQVLNGQLKNVYYVGEGESRGRADGVWF